MNQETEARLLMASTVTAIAENPSAAIRLSGEDFGAADRARQEDRPRSVPVFGREEVTADKAAEHRQRP
jgi:hypothetical protein